MSRLAALRRQAGAFLVDNAFRGISRLGRLHPQANPARHGVSVERDLPYPPDEDEDIQGAAPHVHTLDLYRPEGTPPAGGWPVVLYIHGGGFRILSKDTHWLMALVFARRGYLVFNINYRLAPQHRYPAALADACAAYRHVVQVAGSLGGDLSRLVVAGESAGANLATSLALACTYQRPEPFAQRVFQTGVVPKVVLPACGIFQVSDIDRIHRRRGLPLFLRDRLGEVAESYLPRGGAAAPLADPLLVLEDDAERPQRPLPPFFLSVGTRDPLLDDSRRMKAALQRRGAACELEIYPGEPHAFHAVVLRESARRCWEHHFDFLEKHLGR